MKDKQVKDKNSNINDWMVPQDVITWWIAKLHFFQDVVQVNSSSMKRSLTFLMELLSLLIQLTS
jgi:hypothetical protein